MATGITNVALAMAIEALFGFIRPLLIDLRKLGTTDFSAEKPSVEVAPGKTINVPLASVAEALEFNKETNNYLTGGATEWAVLTALHYLQGFDISGTDIDKGIDAVRIEQLFSKRASTGILMAITKMVAASLAGVPTSTAVTLPAAPTFKDYLAIFGKVAKLNKVNSLGSVLGVSGEELGNIKAAMTDKGITPGDDHDIATMLGFADLVRVPGTTERMWIVPPTSFGMIARVPEIIARYISAGAETDPETGLSIGIVVADDQAHNRRVTNADLWFGCTAIGAPPAADKPGIIKVGTAD